MAASPFFTTPINASVTFVNADGTATKDLIPTGLTNTVGGLGGRAFSLSFTNDDSASIIMVVSLFDGTTARVLREISVAANAGAGTVANQPAELFTPANLPALGTMPALLDGWPLNPNCRIRVNAKTAVPATRTVTVTFSGGNG